MPTRSLESIKSDLRAMLPDLAARYGVGNLWVFGSRARGEGRDQSDLDLLVEFSRRGFSLLDFIGLEQEIGDRLGLKVDLVEKPALRPEIAPFALRDATAI